MDRNKFAHKGDPCVYCRTPHDEVVLGPCPADRNRRLAELLGMCWHDFGTPMHFECLKCGAPLFRTPDNPDFAVDPLLVLGEMQQRGLFYEFVLWTLRKYVSLEQVSFWLDFYILDTTGKLRDMAIEFLEKDGKG